MERSAFVKKLWGFLDAIPSEAIRVFKNCILFNSDKCEIVDYTDKYTLNGVKPDDLYLYNLCCVLKEKYNVCVVTTDKPLIEIFKSHGLKIEHRDEFVKLYIEKCIGEEEIHAPVQSKGSI